MPSLTINDFKAGLDKTRLDLASPEGTVSRADNCHLTRGGELEKRLALSPVYTLPAGTFGLAANSDKGLVVFGSAGAPIGMPSQVSYQNLQHPDGSTAMTALVSTALFSKDLYAIAQFGSDCYLFKEATIVPDFVEGVVRSDFINNDGTAEHLRALIDANSDLAATRSGAVITITGQINKPITYTATATNVDGGTDDQTLVANETQAAIEDTAEVLATTSFTIEGGSSSAGTNTISSITINSVSILSAAVDWTTSNELTAKAIADDINGNTTSPNYTATNEGSTVIISAASGSGDTPNGYAVEITTAGDVVIGLGAFEITGGTSGVIAAVLVDGSTDLLNSASVAWGTSNSATASAVAADIRAKSGTTGYTAFADQAIVRIGKLVSNAGDPNNLTLQVNKTGDVAISDTSAGRVDTGVSDMTGGVDATTGQPTIATVTVGGTFEPGDLFTLNAQWTDSDDVFQDIDFGAGRVAGLKPLDLTTLKQKLIFAYVSGFGTSGVALGDRFNRDDAGAGILDIANESNDAGDVVGVGVYQNNLAVFAENSVTIQFIDPDPNLNRLVQNVLNTGSLSRNSIVPYGEVDLFYLDRSGIRSLRARDSSNLATLRDVGTPIDSLIAGLGGDLETLTDAQIAAATGIIEPSTGRYFLALGTSVYVFTSFPSSRVSGWTRYVLDVQITEWVIIDRRIYARAGDIIYALGGLAGNVYDTSEVVVDLAFYSAGNIARFKRWTGFGIIASGVWDVYITTNPDDVDGNSFVKWATIEDNTLRQNFLPFDDVSEVVKLQFRNNSSGAAILSKVMLYYEEENSK